MSSVAAKAAIPAEASPELIQARAWLRKIPATEKAAFIDRAQAYRDRPPAFGTNETGLRKTIVAICDLFPWPSRPALLSAAETRLKQLGGHRGLRPEVLAYQLVLDLLENPDALLG